MSECEKCKRLEEEEVSKRQNTGSGCGDQPPARDLIGRSLNTCQGLVTKRKEKTTAC